VAGAPGDVATAPIAATCFQVGVYAGAASASIAATQAATNWAVANKAKKNPTATSVPVPANKPVAPTPGDATDATKPGAGAGAAGEAAKPRAPVTDLPRDASGNIVGGVGGGKGRALSDAEAEAVREYEAGGSPDQKVLNGAKDKLKGQEKYQGTRNRQKRGG
jgi:hypothetical protein